MELPEFVADFAEGVALADSANPVATNNRTGASFKPGLGPHTEAQTISLVMQALTLVHPERYAGRFVESAPYPEESRSRCDLCLGATPGFEWAFEAKLARMLGDNGKPNDNLVMHLLSPYQIHRSAVTDSEKLAESRIASRKGILIFGYESEAYPLEPLIASFELLASRNVRLGHRNQAPFNGLVHPVHASGNVYAWELIS